MPVDVLVAGAGPGGVSAAVQLHRLGARVHWWDRSGQVGGLLANAHCVENWPGMPAGASGRECCRLLQAHASFFGLFPELRELAAFHEENNRVHVTDAAGREELYDALVLAVGTLPLPWEQALLSVRVVYEYARLPEGLFRLLVVGGGEAACDGALHAAENGRDVVLAVRSNRLKARGILARRALSHPRIDVRFSTRVHSLKEQETGLACSFSENGALSESFDAVLFCGGRVSALRNLGHPETGQMRLSSRIRVVGDARHGSLGQGIMAAGDGVRAAAEIMEILDRQED